MVFPTPCGHDAGNAPHGRSTLAIAGARAAADTPLGIAAVGPAGADGVADTLFGSSAPAKGIRNRQLKKQQRLNTNMRIESVADIFADVLDILSQKLQGDIAQSGYGRYSTRID